MLTVHDGLDARIANTTAKIDALFDKHNTVICSTKFGSDSTVFLHLVTRIKPDLPILWVDTGYNNRDTMAFVKEVSEHLSLRLHVFKPKNHDIQAPPAIDHPDHAAFTEEVKLAPFREGLSLLGATHWISSVRAYQTPNRKTLSAVVQLSEQLTKVHPMLDWSKADMQAYRKRFSLPAGPPAYDPTKGEGMRECGLHEVRSYF